MQIHADFRQAQFLRSDQPVESIGKPILGAIEDRAENFYAKIPKPEPPQAERALGPLRSPRSGLPIRRRNLPTRPFRAMWRLLTGSSR
jgi:hypothetical protein